MRDTEVKVFVTHNLKFRAAISEPDKAPYEVTIGGNNWSLGIGRAHRPYIIKRILKIIKKLSEEALKV